MTKLLSEDIARQVQDVFEQLQHPVQIIFFGSKNECDYCDDTRRMVEELATLSDKIEVSVYDIEEDAGIAQQFKVDKTPGMAIVGREGEQMLDFGIRLSGIPAGHEFSSLVHDIVLVSSRDSGLSDQTRKLLEGLQKPVLLQVFVTPTCPYCPRAVVLAHQMAMESPMIEAEMVEAMEFSELSERHNVSGVPHTVINEGAGNVVGAVPEEYLLAEMQRALAAASR
ncbi:MAG: glutaredoxin [Chloroflexota bacterium]|nr:MAG: glutaredoxin [Chloroflexota bacterium]